MWIERPFGLRHRRADTKDPVLEPLTYKDKKIFKVETTAENNVFAVDRHDFNTDTDT